MLVRHLAAVALIGFVVAASDVTAAPSVIFILLDTTRADRLSAWGNPRTTTPTLDALGAAGAQFRRHFANAHATRPSMPQLMSGRYYRNNVLGPFQTDAHPREMSFARSDPTATLLPAVLRARGYVTVAVSAHTWVVADSDFGRQFDHFELLPFTVEEAHGDAVPLVDRAVDLWRSRDRTKPLFMYLHFMDMHIPRVLPEGEPRFVVAGYDWRRRFRPNGEADFGRERRRWSRGDARDFTDLDRAHYTAVYDTRLQYTDDQLARLLAVVRADDPTLRDTVIVVTADHGEELGDDGRIEHTASLDDGVQHVPWIVAGGPVGAGQRCDAVTEHVDVVPSLLALVGATIQPGVIDGSTRLGPDGRLTSPCGGRAAYYAWEDYRAVRLHHYLLVQRAPGSFEARCHGTDRLYRVDHGHRRIVAEADTPRRTTRLRRMLAARLDARERAFRTNRYGRPTTRFVVRTDFWDVADEPAPNCVPVDENTPRSSFRVPGWTWSGRGLTMLEGDREGPLDVRIDAPSGTYEVDVATTAVAQPPWFFGFERWRRKSFLPVEPSEFIPLGTFEARDGVLRVALAPPTALGHHILGLRLAPPGATGTPSGVDETERERLKALGYIQ